MNNYNYHPIRWYTTTLATLASFSLWFTWTKQQQENLYFIAEKTNNGYHDWGFLTVAGIIGVFVAAFIGDKMKPFDQNSKLIACASFAVIALGGIISMAASSTNVKTGAGPWIAIVLGIIGLVLSTGIFKIPDNFPSSFNQAPPPNTPLPPPPPPPPPNIN